MPHKIDSHMRLFSSAPTATITLMATSDLHMNLMGYDYYAEMQTETGLAYLATTVQDIRNSEPNCLLFDNGDLIQGPPSTDLWLDSPDKPHVSVQALNALNYDCATLGNHEFNFGLKALTDLYRHAYMPVVASNISRIDGGDWPFKRFVILERDIETTGKRKCPIKIGVIGLAPETISIWDRTHTRGKIETTDPVTAAAQSANAARAAGADIVIALCHGGLENETTPSSETFAGGVAGLADVDAVFAGHTHVPFSGKIGRTPIAMPAANGAQLAKITLNIRKAKGAWVVDSSAAQLLAPASTPAPAVMNATAAYHAAAVNYTQVELGQFTAPANSYFARVQPDLSQFITAQAQLDAARDMLDQSSYASLPRLSATAPFRSGGRGGPNSYIAIDAGPATNSHAAQLYPFPNQTIAIQADGALLRSWLERAAEHFNQINPNAIDAVLFDDTTAPYNLDTIFGVTYDFDLSADTGDRVRNLTHNGAAVTDDDQFIILTNSYRANGGGGYDVLESAPHVWTSNGPLQSAIANRLSSPLPKRCPKVWGFSPLGATVVFDSAPQAADHLTDIGAPRLQPIGPSKGGFYRFRMDL